MARAQILALALACYTNVAIAQSPGITKGPATESNGAPLFDVEAAFEFSDAEQTFDEIRKLILERYYTDTLDESALYLGAIEGMLRRVSPPKTPKQARLWTAEDYQRVLDGLQGKRASIGIRSRFDAVDGSLTVTDVTPDSPADGRLKPYDRIMRIDSRPLAMLDRKSIHALLNDPPSGSVTLTVVRDIEVLTVELKPTVHDVQNLETGLLPGAVAYVRVNRITTGVTAKVREALNKYVAQGVKRLVLDVRNNGGGVFIEGLRLAEIFIPARAVLLQVARDRADNQRFLSGNDHPLDMQVVILANQATASSAEAMAAALVSAGKATLVGTRTYGKATMEQTFTLSNKMRVRFIVGAMYAANGQSWHERGIRPQIDVAGDQQMAGKWFALPLQERLQKDTQLRSAWQLIRTQ
jgi:carboxyl-terminal processing protease